MLSRPTNSNVAGQMSVLEVLHKIVDHRNIIFGAGNHELDFFGSLTFCLLRLSAAKNIPLEPEGKDFIFLEIFFIESYSFIYFELFLSFPAFFIL